MKFTISVDEQRDLLLVGWDNKSPKTERQMKELGGAWEDFNVYRLHLDPHVFKRVVKLVKPQGSVSMSKDDKAFIKSLIDKEKTAKSLTRADADADVADVLKEEAPEAAELMRSYQRAGVKLMSMNDSTLLADSPGSGKAQPVSEPVLTPGGWVPMGDIKRGDFVIGKDGNPTRVIEVFPQGLREVVEVEFSDGSVVRCDWDHLWQVQKKHHRKSGASGWTKTTKELVGLGLHETAEQRRSFSIPRVAPVQFEKKPFPVDPYTWGAIIGDGSVSQTYWSYITTDHEIVEMMTLPGDAEAKLSEDKGWYGEYRLNGLSRTLREHGLNDTRAEDKEIPDEILYGAVEDRISFLQGLLDTDGSTKKGSSFVEYGTVSKNLALQVQELVQSLGGVASIAEKVPTYPHNGEQRQGQLYYRMVLSIPTPITPFRVKRKLDRWTPRTKYEPTRYITDIRGTGKLEEAQCILVEAEDHLYVTKNYVVTHNTLQTIATMISAGVEGDILVLAPSAAVQVTWPGEIKRWSPSDEVVRVTGTRQKREEKLKCLKKEPKAKRRWILCNIEMAKTKYVDAKASQGKVSKSYYNHVYPELFFLDYENKPPQKTPKNPRLWSAIVVDESHRALITDKSQAYKQTQTRCGLGKLQTKDGAKRIAISGTPFRGKMNNLWGTLNWLFPDKFTSYWNWIDRWFDTKSNGFGTEVARISKGMESDFYAAIAPFTLRRTKAEIAPELPPKLYAGTIPDGIDRDGVDERGLVGHWLEMPPKQKRAYDEMVEFATASLESGTLVANGVLAELTRLKQFATCYGRLETVYDVDGYEIPKFVPEMPSNKFNWLVEFLAELGIVPKEPQTGPDARKVVVASQFTSVINLYEQHLNKMGIETLKITGGVKGEERERAKDLFQTDEGPQVFLLNTIAGGVSLTLDRADDIVLLDETFIPDDQEQVEDRVHRVSRNHNVTVHYVRSLGTIEEKIARTTTDRDNLQKQLLDGERGVDFARKILGS